MRSARSGLVNARSELALVRAEKTSAQEALARAQERVDQLQLALDAVSLGVVVVGSDGTQLARNRVAAELVDGRHHRALVAHQLDLVVAAARDQGMATATLDLRGPAPRVVELRAEAVDPGPDARVVAVVHDVTERHHLDAVRRDFIANVSHELRTPIGALSALAEAMVGEQDPDTLRRLAGRMGAEADRAEGLVADLLDLSRVETTGRSRLETVSLRRLVAEASARVGARAEESQVDLSVAGNLEVELRADPAQVVSALANLLDNAVKYSEPGSTVHLEVEVDQHRVVLSVRDEGIGIPARDHERIFERFYRVDPARSRDTGGTGLGLAIVRHVALNHAGTVTVRSREGEGSTFTLSLPRWNQ